MHPLFLHTVAEGDAFIFEINGDVLLEYKPANNALCSAIKISCGCARCKYFSTITRTAGEISARITAAHETISQVQLVDFFEKDTWKDQRSYTFRFVIQDEHKTLTKAEVDAIYDSVVAGLHELGATIR